MKAELKAAAAKFDALQKRERQMVAAAALVVVGMGGYTFGVEPAQKRAATLRAEIDKQRIEVQTMQAQVVGMAGQLTDPDAGNKAALAETRRQIAAADRNLRQYESKLVPPERVPQLLQAVFSRHRGVQLVSLQTLPPSPLLAPKTESKPAAADAKATPPKPAEKGGNIHKHGLEIKMAGNYLDLLAYVAELEQLPQKLLWGHMSLSTKAWPKSELTLTVYTLSLDPTWMVV